jgi:AAA15 family ATPase/GTPase
MLVEFSVGNFWSFKEVQTFQMQAAKISSKYPKLDEDNVIKVDEQLSLLKSKAVFGANGSGKSNLVRAFHSMRMIIEESVKDMKILEASIFPFQLSSETSKKPTFFQVVFVYDNVLFRYGFEANSKAIVSEWLFGKALNAKKGSRERFYFTREGNNLEVNESLLKEAKEKHLTASGTDAPPLFRENTLYLALLATYNVSLILNVYNYLLIKIAPIFSESDPIRLTNLMQSPKFRSKATELLNAIDPTIKEIRIEHGIIWTIRHIEEENETKPVAFILADQEAEGTKKIFGLSPYILTALEFGYTLIIDEFDAKMHPQLTRKIVELFHSPSTNLNNAQLVFITHDSNLLDPHLLRRDQICFVQKDKNGATELYSLVEFKGVRNDASFEKDYLQGKYRAVPTNLNQLEALFETH